MELKFSVRKPAGEKKGDLFCLFKGYRLLVKIDDGCARIPLRSEAGRVRLSEAAIRDGLLYLGSLGGVSCYTAEVAPGAEAPQGMDFCELRELFGMLDDEFFWLAGHAVQIKNWDQEHRFCGRCGWETVSEEVERAKVCPHCGLKSFPRISPATITAVVNDGRILLARARRFQRVLYSVIAGFVEPGETLEECVRREIMEETGIEVENIRYFGSQPWPFPNSLMIAFTAEYRRGEIHPDESEILEAGWYSPDDLPPVPDRVSIARRLIDWFCDTYGEGKPVSG
jgi:NAD+ diphosphatase